MLVCFRGFMVEWVFYPLLTLFFAHTVKPCRHYQTCSKRVIGMNREKWEKGEKSVEFRSEHRPNKTSVWTDWARNPPSEVKLIVFKSLATLCYIFLLYKCYIVVLKMEGGSGAYMYLDLAATDIAKATSLVENKAEIF